jgi:hypothetical protein
MGVNKVTLNDSVNGEQVIVDMTDATVTPEALAKGVTAYNANGDLITGTNGSTLLRSGFCGKTEADEVYYKFYEDGTLIINGTGEICEGYIVAGGNPWLDDYNPENNFNLDIKKLIIEDGVTAVSAHSFRECENLESVIMADSVVTIANAAFVNCFSLLYIKFTKNITSIGNSAFSRCESLINIEIPSKVTSIGENAFHNCKSLESILIPYGVTTIGHNAFNNCSNLKSVIIPDSVVSLSSNCFSDCTSLEKIVLPSGINMVPSFKGCTSLKEIFIPKSATVIDYNAFVYQDENYNYVPITSLERIYYSGTKAEWDAIELLEFENPDGSFTNNNAEALKNAKLHCEYDPNADTVDGWHIDVRSDDSDPEGITKPTLTFYYEVG